ncbi:flagellar protein FlaG [Shewanella phaeophyticola]|uniref:Flagellar protein FlaG n=1 Tax=Shewanella phaeophyticola TaxID=2978345 RepID=A0ABT2P4C6_9GAMM|nr:flagellar protein FlaG [Shewanella sp. KJ10-1]MCT8987231.1 flagellar protein FlaG [Shewanella sp. KJ10-1]
MEINNTAQVVSSSDVSRVDSVVPSTFSQSVLEQKKLDELSLNKPVDQSDVTTRVTETEPDDEQLQQVATDLTDMVAMMQKGLKFSVDDDSGKRVIKVQDIESGDIIRQIPSEEALQLAQKISEVSGVLMKIEV